MASAVESLKKAITPIVNRDVFVLGDLILVLAPLNYLVVNTTVAISLGEVVKILMTDRNKNMRFDIGDLELMSKDVLSMISLSSTILTIIASAPGVKLNISSSDAEILIFKVLVYIFFVGMPKAIGKPFTLEEKDQLLTIAVNMYQLLSSMRVMSSLLTRVSSGFDKAAKGGCVCFGGQTKTQDDVLNEQKPLLYAELGGRVATVQYSVDTNKKLSHLKKKANKR